MGLRLVVLAVRGQLAVLAGGAGADIKGKGSSWRRRRDWSAVVTCCCAAWCLRGRSIAVQRGALCIPLVRCSTGGCGGAAESAVGYCCLCPLGQQRIGVGAQQSAIVSAHSALLLGAAQGAGNARGVLGRHRHRRVLLQVSATLRSQQVRWVFRGCCRSCGR